MKRLLLIDGNAILHRAFHAYPPFTDKDGNPTNAIYGFFAMLLKLLEEVLPDYVVICFDKGAPTFRMTMYAGYHANRPKMKDGLVSQVPILHRALEAIGIPIFGVNGYEADDLLGTLSTQATEQKLETIIVTGDRDLLQLINNRVKILMPLVGITKTMLFDEKRVEEKYGIKPSQIIDYKALVGDASDNYPGVSGIGPKSASDLLQKYQTLENLYKHIGELPAQLGEKLAIDAEQASLCKTLATIRLDAPVHLKIED
ncbi:MAG TPA: 5'-3' exonuclease H3TH domain-containing protein, partial [Patescibacteria group bacterium]|nr:5'-3' exonuclease H3TH domain-containing protein [Patescibacteria group bacterium]